LTCQCSAGGKGGRAGFDDAYVGGAQQFKRLVLEDADFEALAIGKEALYLAAPVLRSGKEKAEVAALRLFAQSFDGANEVRADPTQFHVA